MILFILDDQPPDLIAGYRDFETDLAVHLGYTADPDNWTIPESAELKREINKAYRYILYPSKIPGMSMPHTWSWMRRQTTITTVASQETYTLPSDFGAMNSEKMQCESESGWLEVQRTSFQDIRRRKMSTAYEGQPFLFAVTWAAPVGGLVQRQEITFYPTPDDAKTLYYEFSVLANALSPTSPYPLGGPRVSQLMVEACKAVGEETKNGQRGDQWNVFRESLADAIALDAHTLTETTVGMMRGQYDEWDRTRPGAALGIRSIAGSTYAGVG